MKFLLHDPHLLSSSPFVRFLRVRGRKNGKQRRTMKLHARTTRFWLPPIYVGSRKRGNRRRKCDVRDQSRRFGSENRRGARPRTQLPRPSRRKVALKVFLLNDIHRRGVYQPSCIQDFEHEVVSNWRNGKCIFLPLFSTMDESISFGLGRRGAELTWILLEGVCMFFLRFEG